MTIKTRAVLAAAAACTALSATALHAETLRYAIGFPPGGAVTDGIAEFNEKLQAETDMALKVYELSLLDLKETPPGVRDGLADAGYVLTPYYPAEFSESNLSPFPVEHEYMKAHDVSWALCFITCRSCTDLIQQRSYSTTLMFISAPSKPKSLNSSALKLVVTSMSPMRSVDSLTESVLLLLRRLLAIGVAWPISMVEKSDSKAHSTTFC